MLKTVKILIYSLIIGIISLPVFASAYITGEEYVKALRELKPSKSIQSLLEDPQSGSGYVEVRGKVINIFEFGTNRFFTLHFEGENNPIEFIYVNFPEDMEREDIENKNIAAILKWDILSLNQNIIQTIELNQDEHYDIEKCAFLEAVEEYESQLSSKKPKNKSMIHQFGKPATFVIPAELATPEELAENSEYMSYNVQSTGKNKIITIIKSVNKDISDTLAMAYADFILTYSSAHGIDPLFVCAILTQESKFKNSATSYRGAQGLGQLMPYTAKGLGVLNAYDPQQNIYGTTKYLKNASGQLFNKYPKELNINQLKLLAASYNAGPGAVKKYGGVPPYSETQNYVVKVLGYYYKYLNI